MARDVEYNYTASDKTGPAADSVARRAKQAQDKITREQDKAVKNLGKLVPAAAALGGKVGAALGGSVTESLAAIGPSMSYVLGGAAIAAAPVIGGTLAAAVIGGAAGVGIIGGVALAVRDPRVKSAGENLGQNLLGTLQQKAGVFVGPVLKAIDRIDSAFEKSGGDLDRIFKSTARFVDPLVQGLIYAGGRVTALVADLSEIAGPVINAFSMGIAGLGDAFYDAFSSLKDNGVDAASAVTLTFQVLAGTIKLVGATINALTESYGVLAKYGAFGVDQAVKYRLLEAEAKKAAGATALVAEEMNHADQVSGALAAAIQGVGQQVQALTADNRSLYSSETQVAAGIAEATKKIRDNGAGLKLNTERGRENRTALAQLANTLSANYQAYLKVNGAGSGATRVAERNRDSFVKVAQAAGYSAREADNLAGKLLGIPSKRTPRVDIVGNAAERASTVLQRLAAIKSKSVTVSVAVRQSGDASALRKQSAPAFSASQYFAQTGQGGAAGGTYRTGGPSQVSVNQRLDVSLDGQPFYAYTSRKVADSERRTQWRQTVGAR